VDGRNSEKKGAAKVVLVWLGQTDRINLLTRAFHPGSLDWISLISVAVSQEFTEFSTKPRHPSRRPWNLLNPNQHSPTC